MKVRSVLGGAAVVTAIAIACFWGFWGAIEAFHEGWWAPTLGGRLLGVLAYISPCLVFTSLGVVGAHRPKIAGAAFLLFGIGILTWIALTSHFDSRSLSHWLFFTAPLMLIGLMFIAGNAPKGKAWAIAALALPILTMVACGAEPAWRVATRVDDGNRGTRVVKGNGVELVWAPQGPGWPKDQAIGYAEAKDICSRLSADGLRLEAKPVNIWRLPTMDEAVRSMARYGRNCGGVWDPVKQEAMYEVRPDKESPLWDPYSAVVYWWSSTETKTGKPLIIVYHGGVFARSRSTRNPSHGFRAVKAVM